MDLEDRPARIARHALQRQVLVHPSFTLHPGILQQYSLYRFPLPPTLVDLPALQWLFLEQQAPPPILRLGNLKNVCFPVTSECRFLMLANPSAQYLLGIADSFVTVCFRFTRKYYGNRRSTSCLSDNGSG